MEYIVTNKVSTSLKCEIILKIKCLISLWMKIFRLNFYTFIVVLSFIEIQECDSNPCENGGTCNDFVNEFNYTCVPGYEGTMCETGN